MNDSITPENKDKIQAPFRSSYGMRLRTISAFLVLTFCSQDLLLAQNAAPAWSQISDTQNQNDGRAASRLSGITIPEGAGISRKAVMQGAEDVIINIQDAHAKIGAQESISKILDNLVKNYNLSLIALEGGYDFVDTSIIKSFPIEEVRRAAATSLMKEGKISAGEFYSMVSEEKVSLYGVDDPALYDENLAVFKSLIEKKSAVRKELKGLKKAVQELEGRVYSPELIELTNHKLLHKNGSIKFTEYWNYFTKVAKEKGADFLRYPNLKKLSETVELEKEIDFKKAGAERDALIAELNGKLSKNDIEKLVLEALQYKQGKLSAGKFHLFFRC